MRITFAALLATLATHSEAVKLPDTQAFELAEASADTMTVDDCDLANDDDHDLA